MTVIRGIAQDLRHATRRLLATPIFTVFAVLSLAVGVAVTTAGYSVINMLFFMDLGVPDPDRAAFVVTPYDGRMHARVALVAGLRRLAGGADLVRPHLCVHGVSYPRHARFHDRSGDGRGRRWRVLRDLAGGGGRRPHDPAGRQRARCGRGGHQRWVVARPLRIGCGVVGRSIRLAGRPFEVIGVAAAAFGGANGRVPGTRLWIPLATYDAQWPPENDEETPPREQRRLVVVGHLADGVTEAMASAELASIGRNLDVAFPQRRGPNGRASERPWRARTVAAFYAQDDTGPPGWLHAGGPGLVGPGRGVHQPREPGPRARDQPPPGTGRPLRPRRVALAAGS